MKQVRIRKHTNIMNPPRLTNVYVRKYLLVIPHCLHQLRMITCTIIVVSGIVLRSNSRYVGPINCTSSLWETTPSIKSINYIG